MEIEFECPATVPPDKAFWQYFDANKHVEMKTENVVSHSTFTVAPKQDMRARAHNEARRILQMILDQTGLAFKIVSGSRYRNGETSQFRVQLVNPPGAGGLSNHWLQITGDTFPHLYGEPAIKLADPDSIPRAAEKVKCIFWACGHKDRSKHV